MLFNFDYGEELFKGWSSEQKREEIGRLVQGFRNGVPVGILCSMSEKIAGDRQKARKILCALMPEEERQAAVEQCSGGLRTAVAALLL